MRPRRRTWILVALAAVVGAARGEAQERIREEVLPEGLATEVLAFVNDPGTVRFEGDVIVPAGRTVDGPLALIGGILTLRGEIRGDVVLLNGDMVVASGGTVTGDVLIVGGELRAEDDARLEGFVSVYTRGLNLSREDGLVVLRGERRLERPGLYLGNSRFSIRAGTGYNRVEGLPILLGPVIRTGGSYPLRFDALATFRTESGLSVDDMGYWLRLEQAFGGGPLFRLGVAAYSEVQPVEDRGLSDLEASLTSLLFHRDLRDYFQNEGWQIYLDMEARDAPVVARLTYGVEDHFPVEAGDPWTLIRGDSEWRPVPMVARGDLSYLGGEVEVDARNNPENPSDGWYLRGSLRQGLDGDQAVPEFLATVDGPAEPARSISTTGTMATLDLRRYARVDPDSDLRLRLFLAGSLQREPLPPQWQHALGGVGSLPGHRRFSLDCGARASAVFTSEEARTTYPFYGCDRTALFQAEYREEFSFDLDLRPEDQAWDEWSWWPRVDLTVAWVLFLDAGRGWSYTPGGSDTETLGDVGTGLMLGEKLGLYWAYPMNGEDRRVNFFVRLQHRF